MRKFYITSALSLLVACPAVMAADAAPVISTQQAQAAFDEIHTLCKADDGAMWGRSLCVPRMFVDPDTRETVLDQPAKGAVKDGGIYRMTLPADIGIANTSVQFDGHAWSMVVWPLPDDAMHRRVLLMHEGYHSIQQDMGLRGSGGLGQNAHLDTRDGRLWLRAEFAALKLALTQKRGARKQALADALLFRAYRRSLWPKAAAEEQGLELNEGLAESTGIDAGLTDVAGRVGAAVGDIDATQKDASYVRSFAYATGPAYAELMDAAEPDWRRHVDANFDFGTAAARAYGIPMPAADRALAEQAFQLYGAGRITVEEDARAARIAKDNARYTAQLVDGPTLTLPMGNFTISFDPRQVHTLPEKGSVYEILQIGDQWGALDVNSGLALIPSSFNQVIVPLSGAPKGKHLSGQGWKVELKDGFEVVADPAKPGSFLLQAVKQATPVTP